MYEREQVSVLLEAPVTLREPSRLRTETGGLVDMCDGAAVDSLRQALRDEEGLTDTIDLLDTLEQRMKVAQQPTYDASCDSESSPRPTPTPCITPPPMDTGPATVTLLLRIVANVYVCSRVRILFGDRHLCVCGRMASCVSCVCAVEPSVWRDREAGDDSVLP